MKLNVVLRTCDRSSLTKVWNSPDVRMLMPIGTHAIHISNIRDISFFVTDWQELWANNWV